MNLNMSSILPSDELSLDVDLIQNKLSEMSEIVVFEHNQPQFVILTLEQYEAYRSNGAQNISVHQPDTAQDRIKIGKLVQESLRKLSYQGALSVQEIENLTSPEYSNRVFGLNFPVLKKYDPAISFEEQKRDANGYNRYYNFSLSFNNTQYLLCSQWVERLHRDRFEAWLKQWEN